MKILLQKTMQGHLAPINEEEGEQLKKFKLGHVIECEVVRKRNPEFHRRYFALLNVGYEAWQEVAPYVEYHGQRVMPNFERFRQDTAVLAGHYDPVFDMSGKLHLKPRSISFSSMDQDEFELLYSSTINVLLERVLGAQGFTAETLRNHVDQVLSFDH